MIYIKDNFLSKTVFDHEAKQLKDFQEHLTPGKSFWVKPASEYFIRTVCTKMQSIECCKIEPILGFFREAKEGQDNDWRIHNDSIIEGQLPDRACVLYMSECEENGLNGTAFWEHKKYGDTFNEINVEAQNRLLIEDSNDLDLWDLKSIIGHKKNRLLSYPCNYFHSKYPNEFVKSRIVFVMFYKTIK